MSGVGTIPSATAVGFCFPILGAITVALRFYTRLHHKTTLRLDDWLCVPAWLCVTGCCASLLTGVFQGVFVDVAITSPNDTTEQEKVLAQVTAALVIFWMTANVLIKLAVLFFYRRIFVGRIFKICNWTLIGLSLVWYVYALLSWFLYCGTNLHANFEGGWATCAPWGFEIQMGVFCLDSFIDFLILAVPVPLVWRLQLDLKRKIAVMVIFCLGAFAFVAGLCNTIIQLVYLTKPSLAESGENFFQGSSILFSNWPAIEVGVGLIACNLPSLSFRAASAIPKALARGLTVSLSSFRHILNHRSTTQASPDGTSRNPIDTHLDPEAATMYVVDADQKSLGQSSCTRSESADIELKRIEIKEGVRKVEVWGAIV